MQSTGDSDGPRPSQASLQGKGKEPKPRALAVPTRKGKQPKDEKRELLRSAVMAEYAQPGSFTPSQQAVCDWSVRYVRNLATELPSGLVNDNQQQTLFRAVSDRLGIPYAGAYTLSELHLIDCVGGKLTATQACSKYGMCKAVFYCNLALVDQTLRGEACDLSGDCVVRGQVRGDHGKLRGLWLCFRAGHGNQSIPGCGALTGCSSR